MEMPVLAMVKEIIVPTAELMKILILKIATFLTEVIVLNLLLKKELGVVIKRHCCGLHWNELRCRAKADRIRWAKKRNYNI